MNVLFIPVSSLHNQDGANRHLQQDLQKNSLNPKEFQVSSTFQMTLSASLISSKVHCYGNPPTTEFSGPH